MPGTRHPGHPGDVNPSRRHSVVVVGASVAGVRAAQVLRSRGFEGSVTVLDAEEHQPYDKPPLSKQLLTGKTEPGALGLVTDGEFADLAVDLRLGVRALSLDLPRQRVLTSDGDELAYDDLVVATGSQPKRVRAVEHLAGVHYLRNMEDALALRAAFVGGGDVVVIGGGVIGAEVASSARALGSRVAVIEAGARLLGRVLPPAAGQRLTQLHRNRGVDVHCGIGVTGARGGDRVAAVELADGRLLPADVVVVGVGTTPSTEWLVGSGVALGDGVRCDEYLRARGALGVWAIGDAARWQQPRTAKEVRLEHWTSAREQASLVGTAIATGTLRACNIVPYMWSDQHDVHLQQVGETGGALDVTTTELDRGGVIFKHFDHGVLVGASGFDAQAEILAVRRSLTLAGPRR